MKSESSFELPDAGTSGEGGVFATTRWSVILGAAEESDQGREALEVLCRTYWYPVYALVRRKGFNPDTARDFTQEFFAQMLSRDGLSRARRDRGRFRSFLARSVFNFLSDEWDKSRAQKRGGGWLALSIEAEAAEGRYHEELDGDTPDRLFDRAWADELLREARRRLNAEYEANGKAAVLGVLDQLGDPQGDSLEEHGLRLKIPVNTLKSHLMRARQRQGVLIRELIAETVSTPVEVEAEMRHLLEAIARD